MTAVRQKAPVHRRVAADSNRCTPAHHYGDCSFGELIAHRQSTAHCELGEPSEACLPPMTCCRFWPRTNSVRKAVRTGRRLPACQALDPPAVAPPLEACPVPYRSNARWRRRRSSRADAAQSSPRPTPCSRQSPWQPGRLRSALQPIPPWDSLAENHPAATQKQPRRSRT
jgi:hypothetical protein